MTIYYRLWVRLSRTLVIKEIQRIILSSQVRSKIHWMLSTHQQRRITVILKMNLYLIPLELHLNVIQGIMWGKSLETTSQVRLYVTSNKSSL